MREPERQFYREQKWRNKTCYFPEGMKKPLRISRPVERRRDRAGALLWAKGPARELYRDEEISDSCPELWRIAGQNSRWFASLLPRHTAGSWLGEPPVRPVSNRYLAKPPRFKAWRFVLVAMIESEGLEAFLAEEISGDTPVEVRISNRRAA
jgi:hypothetical protein